MLEPLTDEALADRTRRALREAIMTLRLRPGQPLVERHLAQQLGVSTTPIRHAIRQLAHEGLVTITANRTAVVRELAPDDIDEIYLLRGVLEPLALSLAMARCGPEIARAMERILAESATAIAAGDFARLAASNRAFNDAFVAACGNGRLQSILEHLHLQTQQIGAVAWAYRRSAALDQDQHLRILEAVRAGDHEAAAAAVRDHVDSARREFLLAFALYEQELRRASAGGLDRLGPGIGRRAAAARPPAAVPARG